MESAGGTDRGLVPPEGVSDSAWSRIASADGMRWSIRERDDQGEVIGTAYRAPDGSKSFEPGGKRGLIVDWPLPVYAGSSMDDPVFVCEGASDTAALMSVGLDAVGVPMAGQGGKLLAGVLNARHAVIVADNDDAGRRGAHKLSAALLGSCASVRVMPPPLGAKDAREAVLAGATGAGFKDEARGFLSFPVEPRGVPGTERKDSPGFEWVSLADIGPAEPADWIWPGYIAAGTITLLTGLWKAGKTTLVTHLLRDLFRGHGLADAPIRGSVLLVTEESIHSWARRRDTLELDPRIFVYQRENFSKLDYESWRGLIDDIAGKIKANDISLVVIDTLASFWPVDNENDASEVTAALAPLRAITEAGAGLLINHHPRKGSGSNFTASRGSGALPSFVDIIVELRRTNPENGTDTCRTLSAVGRHDGIPPEMVVELTDEGYVMLGDVHAVNKTDEMETIDEILSGEQDGATVETVRSKWPMGSIGRRRLSGLMLQGTERKLWRQSGSGTRGKPYVYHAISAHDR